MTYASAKKSGKVRNGFQRDAGQIVHAVQPLEGCGDWFTPALCGAVPGFRGNGWSSTNHAVSCPKCLKKLTIEQYEPVQNND